jgi:hypothetical protein
MCVFGDIACDDELDVAIISRNAILPVKVRREVD